MLRTPAPLMALIYPQMFLEETVIAVWPSELKAINSGWEELPWDELASSMLNKGGGRHLAAAHG